MLMDTSSVSGYLEDGFEGIQNAVEEAVKEAVSMTRYSGLFLWTGIVTCVLSPVFIVLSYRRFGKRELESRKYNIVAA